MLARTAEQWVLDRVRDLVESPPVVEAGLARAYQRSQANLEPAHNALALTRTGLSETQKQIDALVDQMASGSVAPALMGFLNERANALKLQRETLRADQRRLTLQLAPVEQQPDIGKWLAVLRDFTALAEKAEPTEVQRLMHLLVRGVKWDPVGNHQLRLYDLPTETRRVVQNDSPKDAAHNAKQPAPEGTDWFDITMWNGCPSLYGIEAVALELTIKDDKIVRGQSRLLKAS